MQQNTLYTMEEDASLFTSDTATPCDYNITNGVQDSDTILENESKFLIIFLVLLWIMPQFTAKRSVKPKFRKTNKVNYRQEDEIVNSPQSCT